MKHTKKSVKLGLGGCSAIALLALMPSVSNALTFSSSGTGQWTVGSCTLKYQYSPGSTNNIRKGLAFLGSGAWKWTAISDDAVWSGLAGFDPQADCGPFDGYILEASSHGYLSPMAPVESHGFSYCVGENLYRYGFFGATNTQVLSGDQGVSPECAPPEVAITVDKTALKAGETATVTFTLTQASDDFALGAVAVRGAPCPGSRAAGQVSPRPSPPRRAMKATRPFRLRRTRSPTLRRATCPMPMGRMRTTP